MPAGTANASWIIDSAWTKLPRPPEGLFGSGELAGPSDMTLFIIAHSCTSHAAAPHSAILWRDEVEQLFESEFEESQFNLRLDKLKQIGELGQAQGLTFAEATYPNSYPATATIPEIRQRYIETATPTTNERFDAERVEVAIAGRVMQIRVQGKAGFAQLQQGGVRLQIYVRRDAVGEEQFAIYKLLDLGDHIGVKGYLFVTRTGETSVHVTELRFLTKALLVLPDKYHGLEDVELRYRQRYVDLFMNTGRTAAQTEHGPAPKLSDNPDAGAPDAAAWSDENKPFIRAMHSLAMRPRRRMCVKSS